MYESPKDSTAQLTRFLTVLAQHRETMERQREDLEVTLTEIAAHEAECRRMLEGGKAAKLKLEKNSVKPLTPATAKKTAASRAKASA